MNDIKIIPYEHKYAEGVAKMWNESASLWHSEGRINTKESIIEQEDNSDHFSLNIALDNERVVGYCKLSKYNFDENTLYIDLLNVVPDLLNKKIGKTLLIHSINKCVELGYPRVDLFTWAGNTKAIPLYKKTGFFWDDDTSSTHLSNFIPYLLSQELLLESFNNLDWYKDNQRTIDIKRDGEKRNGFLIYKYFWKKDDNYLEAEFSNEGRGLIYLNNDKYEIKTLVDKYDLIYGKNHKIKYVIKNKTEEPIKVNLKGINDKNIIFDYNKSFIVDKEKIIEAEFFIKEIEKEIDTDRTHPCVITEIIINNKKCIFKTGVKPISPAVIKFKTKNKYIKNKMDEFFIHITNNINKKSIFNFIIPENDCYELLDTKSIKLELDKNEDIILPIKFKLKKAFILNEKISVDYSNESENLNFHYLISGKFLNREDFCFGKTINEYVINCSSLNLLRSNEDLNYIRLFYDTLYDYFNITLFPPKLGKPFKKEFFNKSSEDISFYKTDYGVIMKENFVSDEFNDVEFNRVNEFYCNGIVKMYFELKSKNERKDLIINNDFYFDLINLIFPYNNKILEINSNDEPEMQWLNANLISENWLFINQENIKLGINWENKAKLSSSKWLFNYEYEFNNIQPNRIYTTDSINFYFNIFFNYEHFRIFVLNSNIDFHKSKESFETIINGYYPFIDNDKGVEIELKENKLKQLNATVEISSKYNEINPSISKLDNENKKIIINLKDSFISDTLKLKVLNGSSEFNRKQFLIRKTNEEIIKDIDNNNYFIKNGSLEFKLDPNFNNGIYSCKFNNIEYLDSSYPEQSVKEYWNPWVGGINNYIPDENLTSILNEETKADFIDITDNFNNVWYGIKSSTFLKNHKKYKNLILNSYFITLPGIPILCYYLEYENEFSDYVELDEFKTYLFFKINNSYSNTYISYNDKNNNYYLLKSGLNSYFAEANKNIKIKNNDVYNHIHYYICKDVIDLFPSKDFFGMQHTETIKNNYRSNYRYLLFTEKEIEDNDLKYLDFINFK